MTIIATRAFLLTVQVEAPSLRELDLFSEWMRTRAERALPRRGPQTREGVRVRVLKTAVSPGFPRSGGRMDERGGEA